MGETTNFKQEDVDINKAGEVDMTAKEIDEATLNEMGSSESFTDSHNEYIAKTNEVTNKYSDKKEGVTAVTRDEWQSFAVSQDNIDANLLTSNNTNIEA